MGRSASAHIFFGILLADDYCDYDHLPSPTPWGAVEDEYGDEYDLESWLDEFHPSWKEHLRIKYAGYEYGTTFLILKDFGRSADEGPEELDLRELSLTPEQVALFKREIEKLGLEAFGEPALHLAASYG